MSFGRVPMHSISKFTASRSISIWSLSFALATYLVELGNRDLSVTKLNGRQYDRRTDALMDGHDTDVLS